MPSTRSIMLIGRDPFLLRSALRSAGFCAESGYRIIEAGGIDAAEKELQEDDSILALVSSEPDLIDDIERLTKMKQIPYATAAKDVDLVAQRLKMNLRAA